jgi:hypothetical protein
MNNPPQRPALLKMILWFVRIYVYLQILFYRVVYGDDRTLEILEDAIRSQRMRHYDGSWR